MKPERKLPDNLHLQAMWYACDEMDAWEAAAFERLLADDQRVRDSLITAMSQLAEIGELDEARSIRPTADYREQVRRRLRQAAPARRWARPTAWAAIGALAASFLIVFAYVGVGFQGDSPAPESAQTQPEENAKAAEGEPVHIEAAEAIHFADLSSPDDLEDRVRRFREQQENHKPRVVNIRNHAPKLEGLWPNPMRDGPM